MNPEPGYIDGSIYLGSAHNPVDVRAIEVIAVEGESADLRLEGTIVFEHELWEVPNHDFDITIRAETSSP